MYVVTSEIMAGDKTETKESDSRQNKSGTFVQLPPFQPENVRLWWNQVELRLRSAGIEDPIARYDCVAGGLPWDIAKRVSDLITTKPDATSLSKLESRILKEFLPSSSLKFKELQAVKLGDRRPTEMLREMRELAQGQVQDSGIRELFLAQLPSMVSVTISAMPNLKPTDDDAKLDGCAEVADGAMERIRAQATSVNAINIATGSGPSSSAAPNSIESLSQLLDRQADRIVAALAQRDRQSRSPTRQGQGRGRNRSQTPKQRSRSKVHPKNGDCWYHFKWGSDARHCHPDCKFYSEWQKNNKPGN